MRPVSHQAPSLFSVSTPDRRSLAMRTVRGPALDGTAHGNFGAGSPDVRINLQCLGVALKHKLADHLLGLLVPRTSRKEASRQPAPNQCVL